MSLLSSSPCFDYEQASRYLFERINYEKVGQRSYSQKNFRLARMHKLLEGLGNPHRKYPIIHIAGTKGKGSVAWLLAEAFRISGKRTGLYTSPHLTKLEERFCVDGQPCTPDQLVKCINTIHPVAEKLALGGDGQCTFFELTTAVGFLLFADCNVDVAVIEVGLGGRLDSTNVCTPVVSVITSISFDHQAQLGDTIPAIAGEKAGIIKPTIPVVSGVLNPEAIPVIARKAAECGSEIRQAGKDFRGTQTTTATATFKDGKNSIRHQRITYEKLGDWEATKERSNLLMRMHGKHQVQNAATAIAAMDMFCSRMGWPIDEAALHNSLATTQVPARMQLMLESPDVILDSAHNVASIEALLNSLDEIYPRSGEDKRDRTIIFAASSDKDYEKLLDMLILSTDTLIITQYFNNPRGVESQKLFELAEKARFQRLAQQVPSLTKAEGLTTRPVADLHRARTPQEAYQLAKRICKTSGVICITGSFFLAAELVPHLQRSTT